MLSEGSDEEASTCAASCSGMCVSEQAGSGAVGGCAYSQLERLCLLITSQSPSRSRAQHAEGMKYVGSVW